MTIPKRGKLERRGTVAVTVALLLPVVIGVTALSLDGGMLFLQRRQAQSIADAAASAVPMRCTMAQISTSRDPRRLRSAHKTG